MVLLGFDRKIRITASAAVPLALIILLKSYIHSDTLEPYPWIYLSHPLQAAASITPVG